MTLYHDGANLFERTQAMIKACPRNVTFKRIACDTGLAPSWVSAFARNAIPDPGIHKVQKLHDYLAVECLEIREKLA